MFARGNRRFTMEGNPLYERMDRVRTYVRPCVSLAQYWLVQMFSLIVSIEFQLKFQLQTCSTVAAMAFDCMVWLWVTCNGPVNSSYYHGINMDPEVLKHYRRYPRICGKVGQKHLLPLNWTGLEYFAGILLCCCIH